MDIDKSDKADAKRFRWLLDGHGYFMEENMLCGDIWLSGASEQDRTRTLIDKAMTRWKPDNF